MTPNCSKSKSNFKEWESNSSKKRLKRNWISKCNRKKERKIENWNKLRNISSCNNNKPNSMMKEKNKRNKNIRKRFNLKRKWEINKLKTNSKERKSIKRNRANLIRCWLLKLKNKSPLKNSKWETENSDNCRDSRRSCKKTNKMKRDWGSKLKENEFRYFVYLFQDIRTQ